MTFAQYMEMKSGYQVKTTFFDDFSIADMFGEKAVKDTYKRAFKGWKTNVEFITEMVLVLNEKCWYHYGRGNEDLSRLYADLYHELNDWCYDNLKGDDLDYYFRTTD